MPENVKCADCGYLAVRHSQTRQLLDAELLMRTQGDIPSLSIGGHDLAYDHHPICFRVLKTSVNFRSEEEAGLSRDQGKCVTALNKERTCAEFTPWRLGFTPKEHLEMLQEADRLAWQEKCDKDARDFQAGESEKNRKYNTRNLWALAAIVLATIIGPIIGAVIARQAVTTPNTAPSPPQTDHQTTTTDSSPPPSSPE
jgi:hypothetical protein